MKRKLTEKQQIELKSLSEWCVTILDFMLTINNNDPVILQTKDVINDAYNSQNIRGLKYCKRDINEWAKGLSPNKIEELNKLLVSKFEKNLQDEKTLDKSNINEIIKRGKINNDDEVRLALEYLDQLSSDERTDTKASLLNKLLIEFDKFKHNNTN